MPTQAPAAPRRWRAAFIVSLVFVAAAAAAALGWWYARESPPHQGPIVLISADGLSSSTLPAYGAPGGRTPAIDALAGDGVVFERAYTHSAELLPAEASLLTGLLPPEHGVRDDAGFALADDARTLPELLRNRGFSTGAAVSSYVLRRESGAAQGFSFFDAELPVGDGQTAAVERDGTMTLDAAMRWLRTQNGQRFFLFLQVPGTDADAVVSGLASLLRERGLYDDATIVLAGGRGHAPSGTLDDAALRVPLIVKQPDSEGAGRRVLPAVQQIDLLPTLLDLVRAPRPGALRGRSLRPVLDDDAEVADTPIYAESMAASFRFGGHPVYALLSRDVRYTRDAAEGLAGVAEPGPGASAPDVAALRGVLDGILAKAPATSPSAIAAADEDRLALAGYLSAPRGLPAPPASLDARTQAAVLDAHRRVARLVGERMLPEAVQALQQLSNAHPDLVALRFQLGTLLARSGRVDAAVDAFSTVAAAWPERVDAAVALADTLRRAGRLEDASTQAAHAVTLAAQGQAADLAAAHAVATFVALDRKDAEAAAEQARLAQEADPGLPLPGFVRGRGLFDKGAFEEALEAFTEAERAASASGAAIPGLHLFQGESLSHLERHAEAESQFKEELRAFPHALEPYVSLATLYRASNREADVERTLAALTQAAPTPEGYALAARVWAALGDRARADQLRADARTRFRGDPSLARIERGARR